MNRRKKERPKRRYVNAPNGRVDLDGRTLNTEEWIEVTNRSESLEAYLRQKKAFEAEKPRAKALKLLRSGGQHYLLNRSAVGIRRLRYSTQRIDDLGRRQGASRTVELADLPPTSFVGIGPVPGAAQRARRVRIVEVEWSDGAAGSPTGALKEWAPHNGGTRAARLDLRGIPRTPTAPAEE